MASATSESPLRRVAKELANKSNSPVEVNRLKSLLRKKIGEDATTPSSPKKPATPRKEVKVKRGATVKLCSSCENHNKDVKVKPRVDNQKEGKDEKTVDGESEVPRKTRTAKKKVEGQGQGQTVDPADGASGTVEKKTAAKKPRETKKKTVTQGEKLGVPSTSGTGQSDSEGSALTDSGTTQAEGEAKPKRQRKNTEKSVQDKPESSVGKEKPKIKEVLKVKIALPKKKTKNAPEDINKTSFENMNETDLVNSVHQGEDIQMQNPDGKSTAKSKSKKPNTGEVAHLDETSTKNNESSVDEVTSSKSKTKAKGAVKPKVSRQKKTDKNVPEELPFDNMDVTDLVTSIQQIEKQFAAEKPGTSNSGAKSKATNTSKGRHVNFEDTVASDSTLVDTDEPSDNLESSSVAKEPPKSKAKANSATKVKSHLKKTTKNLPEDNPHAGFEDMDVTDLVNSIQERKEVTEKSSSSYKNKLRKPAKAGEHNTVNSISSNTTSNSLDKPSDNLKNNSHNEGIIENSEDMFGENSITSNEKGASSMNFSSDKTAPKDKLILVNASNSGSCLQGDERNKPLIMHSSFEDRPFEFYVETNFEEVPEVGMTGTSTGEMINLSSSTNISHNDLEGHAMSLNNIEERSTNNPSIHNDETFYNGDFSHIAVNSIEAHPANITLRTRANKKKNQKNSSKSVAQENTSWADGSSFFTQKDRNDYMTQKDFNENDENKQSSTADMEHLGDIKSEPLDDFHGTSSQSLSKESEKKSKEPNLSHEKSHKKTSKLAEPKSRAAKKSQAKTSEAVESVGQKSKNMKESAKEAAQKSVDKSVNKSSHQESESSPKKKAKLKKNDEKHSKKEDKIRAHHLAKEKKSNKQLKKDMKVAKAMAQMSEHFSRISIGTTIGTINELHIGKLSSDSDSSCDCSTDCSCSDYTSESTSSGGRCNCWKCLMTQSDPSDCEFSSSDDDESSDESDSSESTISASSSSDEEIRHPKRMCSTKSAAKPTYKEKLNKFCSKYDLRSNSSRYGLRSKDK